jgi:hypothetical protein
MTQDVVDSHLVHNPATFVDDWSTEPSSAEPANINFIEFTIKSWERMFGLRESDGCG